VIEPPPVNALPAAEPSPAPAADEPPVPAAVKMDPGAPES
jgi:hypothetical protein